MGCEFEVILWGGDADYLLAAAEEALDEVRLLEEQLSDFIPTSEISFINAVAGSRPVRVEPRLFRLLQTATRISAETGGAFDVASGALVDLWNAAEHVPSDEEISEHLRDSNVILDEEKSTIRFANPSVKLNLGAIGKGYAVARVVEFLRDREIANGLVSAGSSTVYALGAPPDDDSWTVGIKDPVRRDERITSVRLRDRALSTSGSHERFVEIGGERFSHIIDPRTGRSASGGLLLACAVTEDPSVSDALSTAFFVMGREGTKSYCESHPEAGAIVVSGGESPEIERINV